MDFYDLKEIPEHLKSYFEPAPQIGLEATPEQFIQKMVEVFREVRRVTREDGVLWLNLGDSYAGSGCGWQKEGGSSIKREWVEDYNGRPPGYISSRQENGIKPKDLMGIPWRVAFALQADGWYFRSAIPWIKRNCMPESTTDRPTSAIEYIFLMAKSAKYFYDGDAIRCPAVYSADERKGRADSRRDVPGANRMTAKKKQDQTGNPTYTGFNERYKRKKGSENLPRTYDIQNRIKELRDQAGCDNPFGATRNYRNSDPFFESWQGLYSERENPLAFIINPQARPELHFATFPDLLAETCIKAGTSEYGCCPKCGAPWKRIVECSGGTTGKSWHPHADDATTGQIGGMPTEGYTRQFKGWQPTCKCGESERVPCVVLDPFMGSGTVAFVARGLNRSSIGCELNPEYVKIIRARLQADSQLDTGVVSYKFEKAKK